ncbi:MAG: Nudix family hydrolase [Gammaproteobacteria bacterium]
MPEMESFRQKVLLGIVLSKDRMQVLLTMRPNNVHQGGRWEFPGGKKKNNELSEEALIREMKEEINIDVINYRRIKRFNYDYPGKNLDIDARIIEEWSGDIRSLEGREIKWIDIKELGKVNFPPANRDIIKVLQLPEIYFITPNLDGYDHEFIERIDYIIKTGIRLIRFRSTNLRGNKRYEYADKILEKCRKYNCMFIYDGTPEDAVQLGADGLHMDSAGLLRTETRPLDNKLYVAASCHNETEIKKASAIDADFCVLAPVKDTPSHSNSNSLGWAEFSRLAEMSDIPVYALGGMRPEDLAKARLHNAYGLAMISGLWENN